MTRTHHALGIPSIAALLAGLAAGCVDGGTRFSSGSGQCGSEYEETYPLDDSQVAQLLASSEPRPCMDMCRTLGSWEPLSCSWTAYPDSGPVSADGSSSSTTAEDGSTSTEGTSTGGGTSTGSTSTEGTSTEGASTGDASTGDASTTGEASTVVGARPTYFGGTSFEDAAGELHCTVWEECVGGRGHAALQPAARPSGPDALGEWLAAMAHSEAASVVAFRAIADELAAHGAPDELVRRAREAADDEVRHAEIMGTLARGRGVEPAQPRFSALEVRELEALARENAVEGCVRETWAALEACCQARRAADPALRRAMQGIAADESRHAQLSWEIDAWARTRLSAAAVARLDAARREAVDGLERALTRRRHAVLHERAGVPEPAVARELLAELRAALWS